MVEAAGVACVCVLILMLMGRAALAGATCGPVAHVHTRRRDDVLTSDVPPTRMPA